MSKKKLSTTMIKMISRSVLSTSTSREGGHMRAKNIEAKKRILRIFSTP